MSLTGILWEYSVCALELNSLYCNGKSSVYQLLATSNGSAHTVVSYTSITFDMSLHISFRLSAQIFSVLIDILVVIIYCIKFNIYGITQDPHKFKEWKNDNEHSQVPNKKITIAFKINYCAIFFFLEIEPNRRHYIYLCGEQSESKCCIHLKMSGYPMKYSFEIKNSFWGAYMLKYLTFTRSFYSGSVSS